MPSQTHYDDVLEKLKALSHPEALKGMAEFGITPEKAYGVSLPDLRNLAREIGTDHELALKLWESNIRETRILATMVADPGKVSEEQMERWVDGFDYWEICDQCCMNLFKKTSLAYQKAVEWSSREKEFTRRAGFVMMACLAVADKKAGDKLFEGFLPLIEREAGDNRNTVKKAVNWALRQIGKRNLSLNRQAIEAARRIQKQDCPSARWIASDALRELTSEAVQKRVQAKNPATPRREK